MAYEILGLAVLHCTEQWHRSEKQGMPDALSLLNLNNAHHLKCLTWAVYDGALLVGRQPELPRDRQWCTMLAGNFKHIYRGCDDVAHCQPYTLALWDCQERTEVLRQEGRLGATWSNHKNAPRARRRSRRSSRCHSRTPSQRDWSGYSCCSPPNMLLRCHCGEPLSLSLNTTPKLSLAMNVLVYARSSCSAGGMARASLDDDEVGRMTSRPCTPQYTVWLDEMRVAGGTGHGPNGGFWGKSSLAAICPGGHR